MINKKKKITKKEIKEDKLVTTFYNTRTFIETNQQKLLIALGAIVVVIIAFIWYSNKKSEDNLIASQQLSFILPIYEKGSFQEAIDGRPGTGLVGLKSIVENYGNTEQGEIAKIYLANSYFALSDYENALEYFKDYSGSSKIHKASSYAGVAGCYEQKKEFANASEYFNKAAKITELESQKADYLLNAAINLINSGDSNEAKSFLEKIKNDYKTSAAAAQVDKFLAQF